MTKRDRSTAKTTPEDGGAKFRKAVNAAEMSEKAADALAESAEATAKLVELLDFHNAQDVATMSGMDRSTLTDVADNLWASFHALKLAAADLETKQRAFLEWRRKARAQEAGA